MTNKGQFVKITEQMIKQRNEHDTEVTEKTCQIKFDTAKIQVFSVDGCIPYIDSEEGRIVFYANVSSICDDEDDDNNTKYNQCPVELRMTASVMQRILSSLAKEVLAYKRYETEKTELEESIKKHDQQNQVMFG
jgi:hypothetical protein